MPKSTRYFYLGALLFCGAMIFSFSFWPDEKLHLTICDVGQGDAILVKYKDLEALIDGGPTMEGAVECLSKKMPPWDREIELLVLTHPDSDHLAGLISVLERYNVQQIVVNSVVKEGAAFKEFYQAVLAEETEVYSPKAGDELRLGPVSFLVLWPKEEIGDTGMWRTDYLASGVLGVEAREEVNELSIVLKMSFGEFDALLVGDIGLETEDKLDFPEVEVLKIPHHGSKYSTSADLLEESSPELAVISVGKNPWGHPTEEVLEKLRGEGIETLRTDERGEIEIVSDGKEWRVLGN